MSKFDSVWNIIIHWILNAVEGITRADKWAHFHYKFHLSMPLLHWNMNTIAILFKIVKLHWNRFRGKNGQCRKQNSASNQMESGILNALRQNGKKLVENWLNGKKLTFSLLNAIYCIVSIRRWNVIERRWWTERTCDEMNSFHGIRCAECIYQKSNSIHALARDQCAIECMETEPRTNKANNQINGNEWRSSFLTQQTQTFLSFHFSRLFLKFNFTSI